jgi:tetratricopeptide (TPR) repeat protein
MITLAERDVKESEWHSCSTCLNPTSGVMRTRLAEAWVEWALVRRKGLWVIQRARLHLALARIADGKYDEAEAMLEAERRSPYRYYDMVGLLSATAECLKFQGRYADAELVYRRLIQSIADQASYEALSAKSSYGQLLLDMGRASEAVAINGDVVTGARLIMEDESGHFMSFEGNLALSMVYSQQADAAEGMLRKLVEKKRRVLGPLHPSTLTTMGNLALALHILKRTTEAVSAQTEVLTATTSLLGADHPHTVLCKANLADYLACSGQLRRALEMSRAVLTSNRTLLGETHPDTLMAALNLSDVMMGLGMMEEAEQLIRTSRAMLAEIGMPPTGVHWLGAEKALAECLYGQGRHGEAVAVMRGIASVARAGLWPAQPHAGATIPSSGRQESH